MLIAAVMELEEALEELNDVKGQLLDLEESVEAERNDWTQQEKRYKSLNKVRG